MSKNKKVFRWGVYMKTSLSDTATKSNNIIGKSTLSKIIIIGIVSVLIATTLSIGLYLNNRREDFNSADNDFLEYDHNGFNNEYEHNEQNSCIICGALKDVVGKNGVCNSCNQLSDEIVTNANLANNSQTFVYTRENNYIYFGTYPQSRVTNGNLTSTLNQKAGVLPTEYNNGNWTSYGYYNDGDISNYMWYIDLEYESEKYRGVYFTLYRPWHTHTPCSVPSDFQDVNGYIVENIYWFKFEPIKWRILNESASNVTILSELILDSQEFYHSKDTRTEEKKTIYPNNWEYSNIRIWLNETFYGTAFNDLQKDKIVKTNDDNIALLTSKEAMNEDYGFSSTNTDLDTARRKQSSDYAKVQGLFVDESTYVGCSWWWLSTASEHVDHNVARVSSGGKVGSYCEVDFTRSGVVPVIRIQI